jgi:hypothetical protein
MHARENSGFYWVYVARDVCFTRMRQQALHSSTRPIRAFRTKIMFTRLWSIRTWHEFHEVDQKKLSARERSKMEARSRTNTEQLMCDEKTKEREGLPCIMSDRARRRCYTTTTLYSQRVVNILDTQLYSVVAEVFYCVWLPPSSWFLFKY